MKKFAKLPWMAVACLLMELLALIFVTLMLVCPAPFQHSNLALIVVQPTTTSSTANTTSSTLLNNNTSSSTLPLNVSTTSSNLSTSSSAPVSSSTTSAPVNITTSAPNSTSTSSTTSLPASTTAINATNTATATPAATIKLARREILDNSTYPTVGSFEQMERINQTGISLLNGTMATQNTSTLLLRIGPLGSCFRTSDNVETCTSAKLSSKYDFSLLQGAGFVTTGLPSGMSTYPLVLLILVINLLLKVAFDGAIIFLPDGQLPYSFTSPSSGLQIGTNWLISVATIVLAIATGIQRTKMSTAVKNFNTVNQTLTMNSISLFAQTGTSFGFIWISTILLAAVFFCKRVAIKRHSMTEKAKLELLAHHSDSAKYSSSQIPLPLYRAASYEDTTPTAHQTNRRSGLALLRELLNTSKSSNNDPHQRPEAAATNISLPSILLEDYLRRHYHHQDEADMPKAPSVEYSSDYRLQSKESPPFSAYQSALGEERKAKEEARYIEDVRQKMASPAPSYWTMSERAQDFQTRREKEREYMAELRRQRSSME